MQPHSEHMCARYQYALVDSARAWYISTLHTSPTKPRQPYHYHSLSKSINMKLTTYLRCAFQCVCLSSLACVPQRRSNVAPLLPPSTSYNTYSCVLHVHILTHSCIHTLRRRRRRSDKHANYVTPEMYSGRSTEAGSFQNHFSDFRRGVGKSSLASFYGSPQNNRRDLLSRCAMSCD